VSGHWPYGSELEKNLPWLTSSFRWWRTTEGSHKPSGRLINLIPTQSLFFYDFECATSRCYKAKYLCVYCIWQLPSGVSHQTVKLLTESIIKLFDAPELHNHNTPSV
jgi:hypothetical protein